MSNIMEGDHCQKIPTHIILFHILPRLPVESLQRCKSVCQQWHSFLKTRYFARMCNRRLTNGSTAQSCHKLLFLSSYDDDCQSGFRIMDCDDDGLISQFYPLPFKRKLSTIGIQTSLDGLVCICAGFKIKDSYESTTELVIWNPITGEYKMLGKTNSDHMDQSTNFFQVKALGLYYSGMSDEDKEYKLLTISSYRSVHIYSLKSDSWRKVDSLDNCQTLSHFRLDWGSIISSTWFNGNLYFLTERHDAVLKFDTNVEKFTIIPTHPSLNDLDVKRVTMDVHKGVFHLGVNYETTQRQKTKKMTHIQLWKMTEDENWDKVGVPIRSVDISMYPFSWLRNKTWLMVASLKKRCNSIILHKVDYSKNYTKGRNIVTNGKSAPITGTYNSLAKVNYMESFLSIDGSI